MWNVNEGMYKNLLEDFMTTHQVRFEMSQIARILLLDTRWMFVVSGKNERGGGGGWFTAASAKLGCSRIASERVVEESCDEFLRRARRRHSKLRETER